jgi:hypothetical protein
MKRSLIISVIISVGVITGMSHLRRARSIETGSAITGQSPPAQEQIPAPPIPPAPPPPTHKSEPVLAVSPEPARALVGITEDKLAEISRYLPNRSQIATYPIGDTSLGACVIDADLNGDKAPEKIVVYGNRPPTDQGYSTPLSLAVFSREGNGLSKLSSVSLSGNYIQTYITDQLAVPFAVRDITGDGRPDIIVTSAVGASLGSTLQVFSFNKSSLTEIAKATGHYIHVVRETGKPYIIQARWKDGETTVYAWNGQRFTPR